MDGIRRFRECECAIERRKRALLKRLPERFRSVRMDDLAPCGDTDRCFAPVELQERVIRVLREKPDNSYAFFGPPGWAKSHYLAALYRHAVETRGRACYYIQASELVRGLREVELYRETDVYLTDETLRSDAERGIRPRIFLDEVDRLPTFSQFVWAKMGDFFDLTIGWRVATPPRCSSALRPISHESSSEKCGERRYYGGLTRSACRSTSLNWRRVRLRR